VIEETIQNSAYKLQGAEVGRPTGAVEQEIEPVSEECLEPSAANEQLVDQLNEETGADTDMDDVTIQHLPVEGRTEVNITLHSDVDEGTKMNYPAVDAADRMPLFGVR
jgi:hypothetical protein